MTPRSVRESSSSESLVKRDGEGMAATFKFDANVGDGFSLSGFPLDFAFASGKTLVRLKLSSSEEGRPSSNEGSGGGGVDSAGSPVLLPFGGRILNCTMSNVQVQIEPDLVVLMTLFGAIWWQERYGDAGDIVDTQ